jgi:hypothetical protein
MPTYRPDGSIELDTTNKIGTEGSSGGPVTGNSNTVYRDEMFRDDVSAIDGLQADRGYDHYAPGFRYGWESAERHRGRGWTDAERDLEQDWRTRNPDHDWNDYKGSIRHAFDKAMHVFEGGKDPDR